MISDVLSDAIDEIDQYLQAYPEVYSGALRSEIVAVREAMRVLQQELDTPPRTQVSYEG